MAQPPFLLNPPVPWPFPPGADSTSTVLTAQKPVFKLNLMEASSLEPTLIVVALGRWLD